MIVIHTAGTPRSAPQPASPSTATSLQTGRAAFPDDALWIDLIEPTREEDRLVERHLGIEIPTREEMADIEPSEILYRENNALYMTARVLCSSETETPQACSTCRSS